MPTLSTAGAAPRASPATWTLAREALLACLLIPPVTVLGFYGAPILTVVPVVAFLAVLVALAIANAWTPNRWVQLAGGVAVAGFAALNLPFIAPELARPDHYPTYFVGWLAVLTGAVGLTAGIAGFVDAKRHRFGSPRWGGAGAALLLVAAGFAVGTIAAGVSMRYAPAAGTGSVSITPDATVRATLEDVAFSPDTLTIQAGEITRITLTNLDPELHTFTIDALGIDADIGPDKTVDVWLQPREAGTYQVYCKPHSGLEGESREGMVATLVVE